MSEHGFAMIATTSNKRRYLSFVRRFLTSSTFSRSSFSCFG